MCHSGVMLNPVPGPRTHDGLLTQSQDEEETARTYRLCQEHIDGKPCLSVSPCTVYTFIAMPMGHMVICISCITL